MGFDFQHDLVVINLLSAIGTIVKFHHWDGVGLSLVGAGEVACHALDFVTATGWAGFDLKLVVHGLVYRSWIKYSIVCHVRGERQKKNATCPRGEVALLGYAFRIRIPRGVTTVTLSVSSSNL